MLLTLLALFGVLGFVASVVSLLVDVVVRACGIRAKVLANGIRVLIRRSPGIWDENAVNEAIQRQVEVNPWWVRAYARLLRLPHRNQTGLTERVLAAVWLDETVNPGQQLTLSSLDDTQEAALRVALLGLMKQDQAPAWAKDSAGDGQPAWNATWQALERSMIGNFRLSTFLLSVAIGTVGSGLLHFDLPSLLGVLSSDAATTIIFANLVPQTDATTAPSPATLDNMRRQAYFRGWGEAWRTTSDGVETERFATVREHAAWDKLSGASLERATALWGQAAPGIGCLPPAVAVKVRRAALGAVVAEAPCAVSAEGSTEDCGARVKNAFYTAFTHNAQTLCEADAGCQAKWADLWPANVCVQLEADDLWAKVFNGGPDAARTTAFGLLQDGAGPALVAAREAGLEAVQNVSQDLSLTLPLPSRSNGSLPWLLWHLLTGGLLSAGAPYWFDLARKVQDRLRVSKGAN